jgi:hypothetical protein
MAENLLHDVIAPEFAVVFTPEAETIVLAPLVVIEYDPEIPTFSLI